MIPQLHGVRSGQEALLHWPVTHQEGRPASHPRSMNVSELPGRGILTRASRPGLFNLLRRAKMRVKKPQVRSLATNSVRVRYREAHSLRDPRSAVGAGFYAVLRVRRPSVTCLAADLAAYSASPGGAEVLALACTGHLAPCPLSFAHTHIMEHYLA